MLQVSANALRVTLLVASALALASCAASRGLEVSETTIRAAKAADAEQREADQYRRAGDVGAAREVQKRADANRAVSERRDSGDGFLVWLVESLVNRWLNPAK